MLDLFHALDVSEDGHLDFNEFAIIADNPGVQMWLSSLDIDTDDLKMMFHLMDVNGNGRVCAEEIVSQMPRFKGTARNIDADSGIVMVDGTVFGDSSEQNRSWDDSGTTISGI